MEVFMPLYTGSPLSRQKVDWSGWVVWAAKMGAVSVVVGLLSWAVVAFIELILAANR